jgi:hypothetical protein
MNASNPKISLDERRLALEESRFAAETKMHNAEQAVKSAEVEARKEQASFDRDYRLKELEERRAERALKKELEGSGIRLHPGWATVIAAAVAAFLTGIGGGFIQGWFTRGVEADKARANIDLETRKE